MCVVCVCVCVCVCARVCVTHAYVRMCVCVHAEIKCTFSSGDTDPFHFIRVLYEEENYVIRKNLPTEDFAHHAFHLHPPLFFQNLLPFTISTGDIVGLIVY